MSPRPSARALCIISQAAGASTPGGKVRAPPRGGGGRDEPRVAIEESPGAPGPLAGIVDADARRAHDARCGRALARVFEPQLITEQVGAIQPPIDAQRAAQETGSPGALLQVSERLEGAEQHRVRYARACGDDVQTVPEAVDEINVRVTCGAEHDLGASRAPARGMGREITRTEIGLGLDDPARAHGAAVAMHQMHADQCPRDGERAALEKAACGFSAAAHRATA